MLYPKNFEQKVAFDEIRTLLKGRCISTLGVERVDRMEFMTDARVITKHLMQVKELQQITDVEDELPGEDFFDLRLAIKRIRIEGMNLEEQEMWQLKRSLDTLHSWIKIIRCEEESNSQYPALEEMANGVFTFYKVTLRIDNILDRYGHIKDDASPEMLRIRREMHRQEGSVSRALNSILESAKTEGLIEQHVTPTLRDGRLVIPVAPALKRRIRGIVHDESATGKTIFIEPASVVEANNRIRELEADERREMLRILQEFTDMIRPNIPELLRAYEFLADLEFVRAKATFAMQTGGIIPTVQSHPVIDWTLAQHPLLALNLQRQGKKVVPLDIKLTRQQHILIISGPNAGGKSVCLKTVGLLQYMLQCGIPIPLGEASQCGIFESICIDIGDEQSINDDLSTYSSHLMNMKQMMRIANEDSLLLIDEFGGGTEPTIGGALAQAVLERFVRAKTFGVITTHYQNLKHYAEDCEGLVNGAMLYDRQQMQALFQLQIGNPGSSFAVEIARKIGIPEDVIADASQIVGQDYINADKYLLDIVRDKRYWEGKRQTIHQREKQLEETILRYEQEMSGISQQRKEIIQNAKDKAQQILAESNAQVENTIREIREAQADKERTREVRQQLNEYREQVAEQQHGDDAIDRKMRQIAERQRRKEERRKNGGKNGAFGQSASVGSNTHHTENGAQPSAAQKLDVGNYCRIKGQTTVGHIESITGHKAIVTFGMMRTQVPMDRLEACNAPQPEERPIQDYSTLSRQTQELKHQRSLNFHQDIDVRGQRGDEALDTVMHYIDDAILVGASRVRILHGTGTGALRQLIRQYLRTIPQVTSARDEHVQFGGAGITVVELE